MSATESRLTREEFARRGNDTFARLIGPLLRPEDDGKFVALDIVSGDYELDRDDYTAVMRLHRRLPGAQVWLVRVGSPTACRIGCGR